MVNKSATMKPRELILCALLLVGGTAVVAVGWHMLATPATPAPTAAPVKAAAAKTETFSSGDFNTKKKSSARNAKSSASSKPDDATETAEPALPFNEAVQAALAESDKGDRFRKLLDIVKKLDASQIAGAMEFAGTLEGRERDMMQRLVTGRWAALDPMAAIAFAKQNPDKNASAEFLRAAIFGWSNANPTGALSYIQSLPAGADRSQNLQIAMSMWARNDPQAAANYITSLPAADQAGAVSRIAGSWAGSNPNAALQWAGSLTDEAVKGKAYQGVMYTWAREDAASASTWLQSLPQGAARDQAVIGFTQVVGGRDPQSAVTWAQTITDPQVRTANLEQIAGSWMRHDATTAKEWISQTNTLAPEAKTRILTAAKIAPPGFGDGGFGRRGGPPGQ